MRKVSLKKILLFLFVFLASCSASNNQTPNTEIKVRKNLVLLHGLGRSKSAMWLLASRLEEAGFSVFPIGYKSFNKSPEEILTSVTQQIESFKADRNTTMHFVGHSLGGLMIRAYLSKNKIENLGKVVLIGTPNKGTTLVDTYRDRWWLKMTGEMTLALGTDDESFPNSIPKPYYPVGIIAGVSDGMNNEHFLPGEDDGVVSLESTKVDGMTDIVIVESSHSMMRYNLEVANQTIAFLKNGLFEKTSR